MKVLYTAYLKRMAGVSGDMKNVIAYIILLGISVGCSKADKSQRHQNADAPKVRQAEPSSDPARNEILAPRSDDVTKQHKDLAPGTIDATQAIAIAEKFVHDNGYTDYKPDDPSKLIPESIELTEQNAWLDERFNTISSKAKGYLKRSRDDPNGWTIGFERTNPRNPNNGRAVTMDARGGMVRMQHQDLVLDRLLPRPD